MNLTVVLVLTIMGNAAAGGAIQVVDGFFDRQQCEKAGQEWISKLTKEWPVESTRPAITYVCMNRT